MGNKLNRESVLRMAQGAFEERVDRAMAEAIDNTRDTIYMAKTVQVKPRVKLTPFRTFLEVSQPESEYLVRVDKGNQIGLFEADGGIWKLEAKKNIAVYFERELADLIEAGKVVVIR